MTTPVDRVTSGGGVVGLCTAHFLERAGCRVTVVERAKVGAGASWGNAGELATDLAEPFPAPGMISEGLHSLSSPDGALYIRPRPDKALLRFLALAFWALLLLGGYPITSRTDLVPRTRPIS